MASCCLVRNSHAASLPFYLRLFLPQGNAPRRVIHIPSLSQAFLVYRTLLDDLGKTLAAFAFDVNFEVEKEATGTERVGNICWAFLCISWNFAPFENDLLL